MKNVIYLMVFLFLGFAGQNLSADERWLIEINGNAINAEIVRSEKDQQMGLGSRFSLPEGNGMLFAYDRPGIRVFWMKRMRFPIDIIWIQNNTVVHIEKNVQPPPVGLLDKELKLYGQNILADMVLEVPSGYSQRHSIRVNHRLKMISHP